MKEVEQKSERKCSDCSFWFLNRSEGKQCYGDKEKPCKSYWFRWDSWDNRKKYMQ